MRYSASSKTVGLYVVIVSLALAYLFRALAAATMPPALQELQPRLAAVIKGSQPTAILKWDAEAEELVGQYQTQPFQVHRIDKSGQVSTRADTEWGPNYQGFLMRLRVDKTPYAGQSADPFRVWHRIYWDEYINEYPLSGAQGSVLRLELAYGSRADSKLLEQIKSAVASYATGGAPAPASATITRLETVAAVTAIEHTVEITCGLHGTGPYGPVQVGEGIVVGDVVRTGRRSKADIKFFDGSLLRLGENTAAKINAPDKIQILSGQGMLVNLHKGTRTIITSAGVAAVRG